MTSLYERDFQQRLERISLERRTDFGAAQPFPHVVIDEFLPQDLIGRLIVEFPERDSINWQSHDNLHEVKRHFADAEALSPTFREVLHFFNSAPFLRFLEKLSGISNLIPDPYFDGGGLHVIERGGKLDVHVDFNRHPQFQLDRRLNLLLYLNADWCDEFGGHLELWNPTQTECSTKILPIANRCVIFRTTDASFHGHPAPLECPPTRSRRSIALYYYSNGRPPEEQSLSHGTVWARPALINRGQAFARWVVPPIFLEAYRRVRKLARRT